MLTLKLFHLLLFVYWLGADVGTFYAARFVANPTLAPAARMTAAKIMLGIDIAPRLCMPLVLATGVHLAWLQGHLPLSGGAVGACWGLCLAWVGMVVAIHHLGAAARGAAMVKFDFGFRTVLLAGLALTALGALFAPGLGPLWPNWLAFKLLCYAATMACGLMIRVHLRPFTAAFGRLAGGHGDAEGDRVIARAIARCVPWVLVIWALLVASAASGLHALAL